MFNDGEHPGLFGLKYQCEGDLELTFEIEAGSNDPSGSLFISFGNGEEGDSYEEPRVMACCPEYDGTWCEEPHHQACVVDMVEQGCKSLVTRLEQFADSEFGDPGEEIPREATRKLAQWISMNQEDCIQRFLIDTGLTTTTPACDANQNEAFDYDEALVGAMWVFDPDNTSVIDEVRLSIDHAEIVDLFPIDGVPSPSECTSSDENDMVSFLQVDPSASSLPLTLEAGSVSLHGPELEGSTVEGEGALASLSRDCRDELCSSARVLVDGQAITLEQLSFYSDGVARAGNETTTLLVDAFRIHLYAPTDAFKNQSGTYEFKPGTALFVLSAYAEGERRILPAWNLRHPLI